LLAFVGLSAITNIVNIDPYGRFGIWDRNTGNFLELAGHMLIGLSLLSLSQVTIAAFGTTKNLLLNIAPWFSRVFVVGEALFASAIFIDFLTIFVHKNWMKFVFYVFLNIISFAMCVPTLFVLGNLYFQCRTRMNATAPSNVKEQRKNEFTRAMRNIQHHAVMYFLVLLAVLYFTPKRLANLAKKFVCFFLFSVF
jgi:hypothetical protein